MLDKTLKKEADKKLKELARTLLKQPKQNERVISNSSYIFIPNTKDLTINSYNTVDVCFARLRDDRGILSARVIPFQQKRWDVIPEELMAWWNWVMFQSSWRRAFKNTSVKGALKNGFDLDTTKPRPYIIGAITAIREGWEFDKLRNFSKNWVMFQRDYGFTPEEAHFLVLNLKENKDGDFLLQTDNTNHYSIPTSCCKQTIKTYSNLHKFTKQVIGKHPFYQDSCEGIPDIWPNLFKNSNNSFTDKLKEKSKIHQSKDSWGYPTKNYFLWKENLLQVKEWLRA